MKKAMKSTSLTEEEISAMKERVKELNEDKVEEKSAVFAKIGEMPEHDRAMAKRLNAIIEASAPALKPRTCYGMPAYAKDGKIICFFQPAHKFKTRYATLGFSDNANLDDGNMWPTSFALKELTAAEENCRTSEESGELRMKKSISASLKGLSPSQEVDAIIKETRDWRGRVLSQLRALIKEADPDVVEEVKWKRPSNPVGVPVWSHDGIICIGNTLKNAVRLTFPKGAQIKDSTNLFNARLESNTVRAIDIFEEDRISDEAIKKIIRVAVALNVKGRKLPV
jgi:hypothetical protein